MAFGLDCFTLAWVAENNFALRNIDHLKSAFECAFP